MVISITGRYEFKDEIFREEYFRYVRLYTSSVHIFYRYLCRATAHSQELGEKNAYYKKDSDMLQHFNRMNNVELIQTNEWFCHCAFYDAYDLIKTCGRHVVFGGKYDFKDYIKGLISKEDYIEQKLRPFRCIGTAKPYKGNQKFRLKEDLQTVVFQPSRNVHMEFKIFNIPYNKMDMLKKIYEFQEDKSLAITYNLCPDGRFAIQVNIEKFCDMTYKPIKNRVLAVDLNPNYVGWVIADWKSHNEFKVIDYGVESFKELNDREDELKEKLGKASTGRYHYTEKKEYETKTYAAKLIDKALYYRTELVAMDSVDMKSSNKKKGKFFNRLVNNKWLRNSFQKIYLKNAELIGAKVVPVYTPYTSVNGNFIFRSLGMPDMCLAAFEMSRRAYLTHILNLTPYTAKNDLFVFPDKLDFKEFFDSSCDEFKIEDRNLTIREIYNRFLKKKNYRVKFEKASQNMKFKRHKKKYTSSYSIV